MHWCHGVVIIAVSPLVLCDVWQSAGLSLLDGFAQWLVVHLILVDSLRPVVQGTRWWRVQQCRHVVNRPVRGIPLIEEVGRRDLGRRLKSIGRFWEDSADGRSSC